jgi:hypothetical protein
VRNSTFMGHSRRASWIITPLLYLSLSLLDNTSYDGFGPITPVSTITDTMGQDASVV